MSVTEVDVVLGDRSYRIRIGRDLLRQPARWRDAVRGRHVLVVTDSTVAPLYLARLEDGLDGFDHAVVTIPAGERHKTLAQTEQVFAALAGLGASRDATVIALGGGVVGDLAGFAAACWMRGIDFVQMPTTLLAMVDSSVGGKTGVNLPAGKNLIGAFHQPRSVIIDTDTLDTLPAREYRAGLAEVVKYGAIGDVAFFGWLEQQADALVRREPAAVAEAIAVSCKSKAGIVARDEREEGERALLNFGHTFGHALETEAGYGTLLHGEAVAIGMTLAASLSAHMGKSSHTDTDRLISLLKRLELPTVVPHDISPARLIQHMRLDKKNLSGKIRAVLWHGVGRAGVTIVEDEQLRSVLE